MKVSKFVACLAAIAIVGLLMGGSLAGCAARQIPVNKETVHDALVPVAAPCVNGERPAAIEPLRHQIPEERWKALQVQQKAALVSRQGLRRQTFGEALEAATASCP